MRKKMLCVMIYSCVCASCDKNAGAFEPVKPPVEKTETPTMLTTTKDLRTITIEDGIMAVVETGK